MKNNLCNGDIVVRDIKLQRSMLIITKFHLFAQVEEKLVTMHCQQTVKFENVMMQSFKKTKLVGKVKRKGS